MAILHRPALPLPSALGRALSGKWLLVVLAMLAVGVAGAQVNQFSRATTTGYQIDALNAQRAKKQADNHQLEAEVAGLSSLARVDWDARTRLHLEPAKQRLYLPVNQAVPAQQTIPTRYLQEAAPPRALPPPAASDPLWRRMLHKLPFF